MEPKPLPKRLYDEAKRLGFSFIELEFSGGSDEGYLSVWLGRMETGEGQLPSKKLDNMFDNSEEQALIRDIDEWADQEYSYSGAGDGHDYGDDITYKLDTNEVEYSEWCMVREDQPAEKAVLEIEDEEEETAS